MVLSLFREGSNGMPLSQKVPYKSPSFRECDQNPVGLHLGPIPNELVKAF